MKNKEPTPIDKWGLDKRNMKIVKRELNREDEKIIEELNKCILLCCRCHKEIHFNLWG